MFERNGCGTRVIRYPETYSKRMDFVEDALDSADKMAEETTSRFTHEEIFAKLREDEGKFSGGITDEYRKGKRADCPVGEK